MSMPINPVASGIGKSTTGLPFPTQTYEEWVASAKPQINAMILNALDDLQGADVVFTQWSPVQRERTEPGRPTLMPMIQVRVALGVGAEVAEGIAPFLQEILAFLPPDIQSRLLAEQKLPLEKRDPAYLALENVLISVAYGAGWAYAMSNPAAVTADAIQHTQLNMALPFQSLKGLTEYAGSVIEGADRWLQDVGPNHPAYDNVLDFTNELKDIYGELKDLTTELNQGNIDPLRGEKMADLASRIDFLSERYDHKEVIGDAA